MNIRYAPKMAAFPVSGAEGYRTWLVAKGRLSRAAAWANSTGVSLRNRAVERTSLAGMSPPPQASSIYLA